MNIMKIYFMIFFITATLMWTCILGQECRNYEVLNNKPVDDSTDWPWIVSIFHKSGNTTTFRCGATLVSKNIVVTAASCVMSERQTLQAKDVTLLFGRIIMQNWNNHGKMQIMKARSVVIHPSYLLSEKEGTDLAYLELDTPIEISENISPICLWEENSDETRPANSEVVVGLVKYAENKNDTHSCNGGLGSGVYQLQNSFDGKKIWVLRGVVSLSQAIDKSGCDSNNYTVFTGVAKLKPWLAENSCVFKYQDTFDTLKMTNLGKKYYYFNLDWRKTKDWRTARHFCRSYGMELASVENEEERNLIEDYVRAKLLQNTPDGVWFWLSGSDFEKEGTWSWTTGQKFTSNEWAKGEPSQKYEEDCLLMTVWSDGRHWWEDNECLNKREFVCELEDVCE